MVEESDKYTSTKRVCAPTEDAVNLIKSHKTRCYFSLAPFLSKSFFFSDSGVLLVVRTEWHTCVGRFRPNHFPKLNETMVHFFFLPQWNQRNTRTHAHIRKTFKRNCGMNNQNSIWRFIEEVTPYFIIKLLLFKYFGIYRRFANRFSSRLNCYTLQWLSIANELIPSSSLPSFSFFFPALFSNRWSHVPQTFSVPFFKINYSHFEWNENQAIA